MMVAKASPHRRLSSGRRNRRRERPARIDSGSSLIEVIVAIGIASIMLTLALGTVHLLLKAERTTTKTIWYASSTNRLASALRSDVHAARSVELEPVAADHGERIALKMSDGGSVSYEIAPRGVSRVARFTNQPEHHEQFRFPESATFHFERLAGPDRVRLLIGLPRDPAAMSSHSQQADSKAAPTRAVPIEAVVSRDSRFASPVP